MTVWYNIILQHVLKTGINKDDLCEISNIRFKICDYLYDNYLDNLNFVKIFTFCNIRELVTNIILNVIDIKLCTRFYQKDTFYVLFVFFLTLFSGMPCKRLASYSWITFLSTQKTVTIQQLLSSRYGYPRANPFHECANNSILGLIQLYSLGIVGRKEKISRISSWLRGTS